MDKGYLSHKNDSGHSPEDLAVLHIVKCPFTRSERPGVQHVPELQENKDTEEHAHLMQTDVGIDAPQENLLSVTGIVHVGVEHPYHERSENDARRHDEFLHRQDG